MDPWRNCRDRDLRVALANCYQALGDLQGHGELQNLGDRAGALESYRKAVAVFDAMAVENPADQKARGGAAVLRTRIGDMLQTAGDVDGALENYHGAMQRAQSLAGEDPGNDRFRRILALCHRKLADLESRRGHLAEAVAHARSAVDINQVLAAADPENAQARSNLTLSLTTLAELLSKTGNRRAALETYQRAVAMLETQSAAAPTNLYTRGELATALVATGALLAHQSEMAAARAATLRGAQIARDLASRPTATPDELTRYASILLTCEPTELRDPPTARHYAELAVERSGRQDPHSLRILADAYRQSGDAKHAVETEQLAASLATSAQL